MKLQSNEYQENVKSSAIVWASIIIQGLFIIFGFLWKTFMFLWKTFMKLMKGTRKMNKLLKFIQKYSILWALLPFIFLFFFWIIILVISILVPGSMDGLLSGELVIKLVIIGSLWMMIFMFIGIVLTEFE